jgi:excisionase family DNA binding protein
MDRQPRDVMTVPELCDYLQLSEAKVREMLRRGELPAILIGRQWRIRKAAIDAWLAAQERAVKVITQYGGTRPIEERLDRAVTYRPEDLPPPKPPRQSRTIDEAEAGAHKPPLAGTPDRKSGGVRRK